MNSGAPVCRERGVNMEPIKKIISISAKRQLTIPQKFFDSLGFEAEAECVLRGNELVIRPHRENTADFAAEILADLIEQGYKGSELLNEFISMQKKIRPAVERMIEKADEAAAGKGEYYTLEDVFGREG
ncbi:MAG: AbrB/MazE/SpoVT family DNA-binding domain-containing protein [Bacillota bacterium]|jgi:hypothetical protein|nr:AbrB/MazE/SpoVT family DNA-binding domain-containing protein [Eubacteriales bacterium]MDD4445594.1 AbrB/MazE/SpoVT family DNA-binding domain-containing protein [Eubacteriales bacterium]MDI9492630.1 AbrB/MazE/SpoVT family DNA-binding domain-containing protein [Bacillota bacterium]HPF19223.1 AbrB/MazE/SpoVT family DNA-binding domain-containing protein [Bacillota bacterium]